ncbi:hypothetical protein BgiBS90_010101 [Biomphalaria glabrata]|nr:hypothetical protein BgiBS90_010101 [Biomphalaria glabrata]
MVSGRQICHSVYIPLPGVRWAHIRRVSVSCDAPRSTAWSRIEDTGDICTLVPLVRASLASDVGTCGKCKCCIQGLGTTETASREQLFGTHGRDDLRTRRRQSDSADTLGKTKSTSVQ